MDDTAAIVLAAGSSSRMGSLKPLLELGERSFLGRAVGAFTAVGVDDVTVVTGYRGDEVGAAAARLGIRAVPNPRYQRGMYSSVQAGVAGLRPSVRRFFILPVDCPLVRPETIGRLARTGDALDADVVLPAFHGGPGHPPLLSADLRAEILAREPPRGLRGLLAGLSHRSVVLETDDRGVVMDADTAADLERLEKAARREDLPSEQRCADVLLERAASRAVVAHSRAVTAVATALTTALNEHDQHLCLPLVVAAALLHDVARCRPRHAEVGATLMESLGYARVAVLVRKHMDLGGPADDVGEAEVLYLADKLVLGDHIVSVEERFADRLVGVADDPAALEAVQVRMRTALAVRGRVEQVLGRPLDQTFWSEARRA